MHKSIVGACKFKSLMAAWNCWKMFISCVTTTVVICRSYTCWKSPATSSICWSSSTVRSTSSCTRLSAPSSAWRSDDCSASEFGAGAAWAETPPSCAGCEMMRTASKWPTPRRTERPPWAGALALTAVAAPGGGYHSDTAVRRSSWLPPRAAAARTSSGSDHVIAETWDRRRRPSRWRHAL